MTIAYASLLQLDRRAIQALKVTDPYSLHRVVYSLFSDNRSEQQKKQHHPSGFVYADKGGNALGRKVLLLSKSPPDNANQAGYGQLVTRAIGQSFLEHQLYRFQVQVNPVCIDKGSGKRRAVKGRAEIAEWFCRRASRSWGFAVDNPHLQVTSIEVLKFKSKNEQLITLGKAEVHGVLQVVDKAQFRASFLQGIGKGRAFGCGLLQIVPFTDNPFA